ncbi:MAG: hypothetical protein V3V26_01430 [Candidatus Aenigmarchaeota archaeon]
MVKFEYCFKKYQIVQLSHKYPQSSNGRNPVPRRGKPYRVLEVVPRSNEPFLFGLEIEEGGRSNLINACYFVGYEPPVPKKTKKKATPKKKTEEKHKYLSQEDIDQINDMI